MMVIKKKKLIFKQILYVFVFSLIVSCFGSINAQVAEQKPPAKRKFKYNGKIEETYEASKDLTTVFFKILPIKALEDPKGMNEIQFSDERLEFSTYFTYKGKTLITPRWVNIGFISQTENPRKYVDYNLIIKADDQVMTLGKMKVLAKTTYSNPGRESSVREIFELAIPYDQFLSIANAKKVKVRFGSTDFNLEKNHLEAIRDLASHTVP